MFGVIVEYGLALTAFWEYDWLRGVQFSPTYKGTNAKVRYPGGTVVSERKISYQILIDLDIQIKAKRNPSIYNFYISWMGLCVQTWFFRSGWILPLDMDLPRCAGAMEVTWFALLTVLCKHFKQVDIWCKKRCCFADPTSAMPYEIVIPGRIWACELL